jgi:pimeloyl-ACP methyl ester carboxylesterase
MTVININDVQLYYERGGSGESMILVHGSWLDHSSWNPVVPLLSERFDVVTYDRRGHSESERPASQGSIHEDAQDLIALIEVLDLAPAHVVTNSYGGNIAMQAAKRPELFQSLTMHEPPAFALLLDDPPSVALLERSGASLAAVAEKLAAREHEAGARQFVDEVAFGPDTWNELPPAVQAIFIRNAPTFLDELTDPDGMAVDHDALSSFDRPVQLTCGDLSPPLFSRAISGLEQALPNVELRRLAGTGHVPQLTDPRLLADVVSEFALAHS